MNRKLTIVLVVMALIPIGLLSWMGFAGFQSEKDRTREQIHFLGTQRLELVRDDISRIFIELETELDQVVNFTENNIDEIRKTTRNHTIITQMFIVDQEGMEYPSSIIPISNLEEAFLLRIKETDISFNFLQKSNTEESGGSISRGWHTWFMGDGINFIYWNKIKTSEEEEVIHGVELNRAAVLSRIINSLPNTSEENSSIQISLLNINNSIQYQWGSYSLTNNNLPDAILSLEYPLNSWHLEYFMDPAAMIPDSNKLLLPISILTLLLIIIMLSIYLYRESTREMREASQKVSFVNQVSHELKTPLTNIRMYAELLETKLKTSDLKARKHLGIIISESARLSRLINNVLSYAKDKKNGSRFNPVLSIPDETIKRTLDSFSYSLKTKGIKLHTDLRASSPVLIDVDIMEQILSNLVSNVEKYASDGKWIKVESSIKDDRILLTVSDRGSGVPEDLKEKIFEPFFRVSNKLTDGVSGTGIGLSLVRTLAETHGGNVVFFSNNKADSNVGAIFQVRLKTTLGEI
ncbi:MAG: HAMP domain-containing sensor histidine kinase [Spirochaetia bacterium]|jgi:signal transduction histidine kinase|nr:HAMP domain-containing sensor histidine kinase [Spirochaetia bacterium]